MRYPFFSRNGEIRPIEEAHVPLSNIEYAYGFGVYENVRVRSGVPYFLEQHIGRLVSSAQLIGLNHQYTSDTIYRIAGELAERLGRGTYNLKVLLIGGGEPQLFILPLNPLFPDKKTYRDGVRAITCEYERPFPHAKTLNMLQSYLAYRAAKEAGAYDALLINRSGCITEGTRTNFFCMKGKTLFSPNEDHILLGVTRAAVIRVAGAAGFTVEQREIRPAGLDEYDAAFLTSTSSGIMPLSSVGSFHFGPRPQALTELMGAFDAFLEKCGGSLN